MARVARKKAQKALEAAIAWRERCLESDGSVLGSEPLWTAANLAAVDDAVIRHPIDDPSRRYYDKLDEQLRGKAPAVAKLAAEVMWLLNLFPSRTRPSRKREDVGHIWALSGQPVPTDHPLLQDSVLGGIGHAGVAFNILRWRELDFAIQAFLAFKRLDRAERDELLGDPWRFASWLDATPWSGKSGFRNILLYLLFPDSFEPIAIARHKRLILRHYAPEVGGPILTGKQLRELPLLELDRRVLDVRSYLERKYAGQPIDFYARPVSDEFSPNVRRPKADRVIAPRTIDRNDATTVGPVVQLLDSRAEIQGLALGILGEAIDHAHRARSGSWSVSLGRSRIRFNVGRLLVLELRRHGLRMTLLEGRLPAGVSDEFMQRVRDADFFSTVIGARLVSIGADELQELWPNLRSSFMSLIEAASATSRKPIGVRAHSPAVLDFLDTRLGRILPRPSHQVTGGRAESAVPAAVAITAPLASFRATELDLDALVSDIEIGDIGLPDIQRPFVWTATKVRDLFDSMYRGYPVGYLLFWQTGAQQQGVRTIGVNDKAFQSPRRLIVDGQQRLTSLFAVMRGHEVLGEDYTPMRLEIAFRPRDGRFEVADAAIRRDPEFIPDISKLLSDARGAYTLTHEFLRNLGERRSLSDHDRQVIGQNLDRLFGLKRYRFSVTEISADLEEEAVADIFVRINSEGVKLKQGDFILTLLSVIWEEGRRQLEDFARRAMHPASRAVPSPFNHLINPSPDQMLRVAIAVGFRRSRLKSVYQLLRGKDPDTGAVIPEKRQESLDRLRSAQRAALDLNNWHQFLACVTAAGYRLSEQISSENALLQAYALYLLGKSLSGMEHGQLDRLISRWFAMSIITGRYSGSPETTMEQDLARVAGASNGNDFGRELTRVIDSSLTKDFWSVSLPVQLETSSIRSPGWSAFVAAQLRLNAPVLFSEKPLWSILDPLTRGTRRAFEVHHLFPKAWLIGRGVADRKHTNQIANFALLEWPANSRAAAKAPQDYVPDLRRRLSDEEWARMCEFHALPADWFGMDYSEFLAARRHLMADIIRRGFEAL